jgi:3-phosphoshikimate 1-carboxyvinyltransferase
MADYPPQIEITPLPHPVAGARATVTVPGSKSLTNRALIVAALAAGETRLEGVLDSDDTRVMVQSLQALGVGVEHDPDLGQMTVRGCGGRIPASEASLLVGNSGTSLRFLTALVCLGRGTYRLDGVPRMRERPVADLLVALNRLGADASSDAGTGCPPLTVRADGLDGGYTLVKGDVSSQFLSGLLMALPYAKTATTVEVDGTLVSKPYIDMTLAVMRDFGLSPANHGYQSFNIEPARYRRQPRYRIEPDASAASYFFAAAAMTGARIAVEGLGTASVQGDLAFVDVLAHMGCQVEKSAGRIVVQGPPDGQLRGVDVDMNPISDTVMTLAAVALFAQGMTRIRNVGHVRHKETDRLAAIATELRKFGTFVDEKPDGLILFPPDRIATPVQVATYDDHRMAMALSLIGLRVPGVSILDPGCVAKTYPGYWNDLDALRQQLTADPAG